MSVRDLQRALEFAHFARRQRDTCFVAALSEVSLEALLLDVQLVAAYGLRGVFVAPRGAEAIARRAAAEGVPLVITSGPAPAWSAMGASTVPLLLVDGAAEEVERRAATLALSLGARRLLLVRRAHAALAEARLQGHLLEAEAWRRAQADTPAGRQWGFVVELLTAGLSGVVLLPGSPGCLFEELFTHHGAGVLVGDPVAEAVRPATLADAADLHLLLKAEMARGVVRPVGERAIAATAHEHLVYTIDGYVVGTARLAPYGPWAELSRFATLPRYRGRGRARGLAEALIAWALERGFQDLFALSVDERMWRFFESLGFVAVERETLPAAWRAGYDFTRKSRAFHRRLSGVDGHLVISAAPVLEGVPEAVDPDEDEGD